jgi:SAM-dependent methyltransferase
MGETAKARARRERDGWFDEYIDESRPGFDLGCQKDPLNATFRRWDAIYGDGDAAKLEGVPSGIAGTVYASHILEHLEDPVLAIRRWWDVLGPGGRLILVVPHRDLYEQRKKLPSRWNHEHKTYWLPDAGEEPVTRGLREAILEALDGRDYEVEVDCVVRDEGYGCEPGKHATGEYSIEAIVRKPAPSTNLDFDTDRIVSDVLSHLVVRPGDAETSVDPDPDKSPDVRRFPARKKPKPALGVDLAAPGVGDRTVVTVLKDGEIVDRSFDEGGS